MKITIQNPTEMLQRSLRVRKKKQSPAGSSFHRIAVHFESNFITTKDIHNHKQRTSPYTGLIYVEKVGQQRRLKEMKAFDNDTNGTYEQIWLI